MKDKWLTSHDLHHDLLLIPNQTQWMIQGEILKLVSHQSLYNWAQIEDMGAKYKINHY